jgi:hypothetical protein
VPSLAQELEQTPSRLIGWFVTEVGIRQDWPFLAFAHQEEESEARLFIDAEFSVEPRRRGGALFVRDLHMSWLAQLGPLVNFTVTSASAEAGELELTFDAGQRLTISTTPRRDSVQANWWFGSTA